MFGAGGVNLFNLYIYAANNPITFIDKTGLCVHNNVRRELGYDCPECLAGITEPEYDKIPTQEFSGNVQTDWTPYYEEAHIAQIDAANKKYGYAKKIASNIPSSYTFLLGLGGKTVLESGVLSGFGYAITTPINIVFHWNDPQLDTTGKWVMTGYEISTAAGGIALSCALSYAVANCWNPSGWVIAGISAAYGFAVWAGSEILQSQLTPDT